MTESCCFSRVLDEIKSRGYVLIPGVVPVALPDLSGAMPKEFKVKKQ